MICKDPRFKSSAGYMLEKFFNVVFLNSKLPEFAKTSVCSGMTPGPRTTFGLKNIPVCKEVNLLTPQIIKLL